MTAPALVPSYDEETEEPPVLQPGDEVAPDLTALELLSRGDALDVYAVWSQARGCVCIAKLIRPDRSHEERVRQRLLQEGRLLLALSHPHLVRAYEVLAEPDPVVVLETVVGVRLDDLLDRQARPPGVRDLGYLGLQLASALRYLHRAGYLHLDVKPANVIASGGLAKLIDLSLARPPGRASSGIGTRRYLAPEQALGEELTTASDVWGLGATLYHAATGGPPFDDEDDDDEDDYPQVTRRAVPLRTRRPRLPRPFTDLVDTCLQPEPSARPTLRTAMGVLARLTPDAPAPLLAELSSCADLR